jgi:hypothetical protein
VTRLQVADEGATLAAKSSIEAEADYGEIGRVPKRASKGSSGHCREAKRIVPSASKKRKVPPPMGVTTSKSGRKRTLSLKAKEGTK